MNYPRFFCVVCLIILSLTLTLAQNISPTESQAEKEKIQKELEERVLQMINQAVGDAAYLKLPQNRAVIYGIAGDLYWKFDEKRARELFRSSANEIMISYAEQEKEKKETDDQFFSLFDLSGNARQEILPMIAKHDADLALELLVQTRPRKIAEELLKATEPNAKQEGGYMNFNPDHFRTQQEIALEQRFALLAAEQNPDKAIKLINESLAKGISWNVLPLLQKLHRKDEKKAAQLADKVIGKITDTDLNKKRDDLIAAIRFLQFATNPNMPKSSKEKEFKFTDAQLKTIAEKLIDTFLQPTNSLDITMSIGQAMPSLEKILPQRMPALKQKQAEALKNLPPEVKRFEQQQKIWGPNTTPEEILAELPKITIEFEKITALTSLVNKISQIEDESRAKKLIEQIPDEKTREKALDAYESAKISRTAKDGKLEDAKKMIGNLSNKKTRIQKLVSLAVEFHKKGTEEDLKTSDGLMTDAKNLTNQYPEDEDELNDVMELVRGYSFVKPEEGFRIFEPVVDQLNEHFQASAVLSKFNKRSFTFSKGELVMKVRGFSRDGVLLFRYIDQIQLLGKADLNRMNSLSDRFQRPDARSIVKLFIAQGFLAQEKKDEMENTAGGVFFIGD